MAMHFISHTAPALSCIDSGGIARSIATNIAYGVCNVDASLRVRANGAGNAASVAGRVYSHGTWRDPAVRAQLSEKLGLSLASALREDFEWYCCRGAFFHNDAHYEARLFGIWCITGPRAELVFPRAAVRLECAPGTIGVFDPFEVHGILRASANVFSAGDYDATEASVFVGFELDLTLAVAAAFCIKPGMAGRLISSRTRISASSGELDSAG
ncbi:MAG: hypothetical protein ABJA83_01885 [Burkholderiaceae bacterium]